MRIQNDRPAGSARTSDRRGTPIRRLRQAPTTVAAVCVALANLFPLGPAFCAEGANDRLAVPAEVRAVLTTYCADCHGEPGKGGVGLASFETLELGARLDLLNKVQEQLFHAFMPPPESDQPTRKEHAVLSGWIRSELRRHGASKLDDKLPYPDYGNLVDHGALFGGGIAEKPFTPARRWLVSPQIFHERVIELFRLDERQRKGFVAAAFHGVQNPFLLPEFSGVRYYDIAALDGGHLLAMQSNADWIAKKQIHAARVKKKEIGPNEFPDQRDRWVPATPAAFEKIVLADSPPTDAEIADAVRTQFDCVLQRGPTDEELRKHVALTRAAVELAGNGEGLRQMLVAVLLGSEFLYRYEFGAGELDEHGRRLLSPREGSYAVAYALGDRGPDPVLAKAAAEGRLATRDDYRREVLRLLADETWFQGPVDPVVRRPESDRGSSHPKLVRFFREFFGYPSAIKIFKDSIRADGYYRNADRNTAGTGGSLVGEADRLVDWVLQRDQAVFETLLTTDLNFMYHPIDNEKGAQRIADWSKAYEILKDTDWNTDPDRVAQEHQETIRKYIDPKGFGGKHSGGHDLSVLRVMTHFEHTFGKGNKPFTTFPWAHGNHYWYSPMYNLPATPVAGRYGEGDDLDYQPVQPFPLPRRKGILTHPAWLIAHAGNTHTDPVRRGKWIREKLLAGRVPDVPITVQAQVPEDPHRSFRQRLELVTGKSECWKCHRHMNPLGLPFDCFDDFGRFRTAEALENPENLVAKSPAKYGADIYKTVPVVTTGRLDGTGDPALDGDVQDPFELIDRLARSERVRQSFVRHTFRFFLGRNELLSDSRTLIDADRAYLASGGSFRAVVASLLTSDSFLYRK